MSKISLVIGREYKERVAKKSFIITTILMPILMLGLMIAPTLIMTMGSQSETDIIVIDESGVIVNRLTDDDKTHFVAANAGAALDSALSDPDMTAVLYIPSDIIENKNGAVKYYSNGPSGMAIETVLRSQINSIIEDERLKAYNIDNLDEILSDVASNVQIQTFRTDQEDTESVSAELSSILGILLTFVLYMFLLLYGQMVMTSIIEEKNNRVLEVVVSSVSPTRLMLGKIIGIALVAVTQIVIWCVLLLLMSLLLLPAVMPESVMSDLALVQAGQTAGVENIDILQALSKLMDAGFIVGIMAAMVMFLIGGFLLYSAIYAAIGSSVDNIQDASQLQSFTLLPIILGMVCAMAAASDPNTGMAFWLSMIPFTSPMVMMARMPFGIPLWEVCLSIGILYVSFVAMVWVAAKIYRIGIFMYGKKPTVKDLIKWMRYK